MTVEFVHLHVHTLFSFLVSTVKLEALVAHAKMLEMRAVALTDHANMFGAVRLWKKCQAAGIQPILGTELNVARRDGRGAVDHLVVLAASDEGYRNLVRLVSRGWIEPQAPGTPSVT